MVLSGARNFGREVVPGTVFCSIDLCARAVHLMRHVDAGAYALYAHLYIYIVP